MSTFFGGPQLSQVINLVKLNGVNPGFNYTVPTGFYAETTILVNTTTDITYTVAGVANNVTAPIDVDNQVTIYLGEGDSVERLGGNNGFAAVLVKVFKKP